jgi:hypothetical protein
MRELESVPLSVAIPAPRAGRLEEAASLVAGLLFTAAVVIVGTALATALLVVGVIASPFLAALVAWIMVRHRRIARGRILAAVRAA